MTCKKPHLSRLPPKSGDSHPDPNPAIGEIRVNGTLTLRDRREQHVVTLSSGNTSLVTVPASVTITTGTTSKVGYRTTRTVAVNTIVNILASAGGSSQQCPWLSSRCS